MRLVIEAAESVTIVKSVIRNVRFQFQDIPSLDHHMRLLQALVSTTDTPRQHQPRFVDIDCSLEYRTDLMRVPDRGDFLWPNFAVRFGHAMSLYLSWSMEWTRSAR